MGKKRRRMLPGEMALSFSHISPQDQSMRRDTTVLASPASVILEDYKGPYPARQLEAARRALINSIQEARGPVWDPLKKKLGILPSGERLVTQKTYPEVWLPEDVPISQWCAPLTLVLGDGNSDMSHSQVTENLPCHYQFDSDLSVSQPCHSDNSVLKITVAHTVAAPESRVASDSDKRGDNVLDHVLCIKCNAVDCLCPLELDPLWDFGKDKQADLRTLITSRKRKLTVKTVDKSSKKLRTSSQNAECAGNADFIKELEFAIMKTRSSLGSDSLVSANTSLKVSDAKGKTISAEQTTVAVTATNVKWGSEIVKTNPPNPVVRADTGTVKSTRVNMDKGIKSPLQLKLKDILIVAEDYHGNKRKLDVELEVKNGKAVLKTGALKSGHIGSLMYKCDYCKVVVATSEDLMWHLTKAQHPSGSQCIGQKILEKGWFTPYCIKALSSLTHPPALFKTVVPVCPVCEAVFESVDDCTQHAHKEHGLTGAYSLRVVCDKKTFFVTRSDTCLVCKTKFSSYEELSMHWQSTKHVNFRAPEEMIMFFHCPYCPHIDKDFQDSRQHVISTHKQQCSSDVCGAVNAVYLGGPAPMRHLMPLFPSIVLQSVKKGKEKAQLNINPLIHAASGSVNSMHKAGKRYGNVSQKHSVGFACQQASTSQSTRSPALHHAVGSAQPGNVSEQKKKGKKKNKKKLTRKQLFEARQIKREARQMRRQLRKERALVKCEPHEYKLDKFAR